MMRACKKSFTPSCFSDSSFYLHKRLRKSYIIDFRYKYVGKSAQSRFDFFKHSEKLWLHHLLNSQKERFGKTFFESVLRGNRAKLTGKMREYFRESMEDQALGLCRQYYQDFHGVFDTTTIENSFLAAAGQGQVFKCECTQELDSKH